jgi:hypothetical protein
MKIIIVWKVKGSYWSIAVERKSDALVVVEVLSGE